jgi:hypothetical protein
MPKVSRMATLQESATFVPALAIIDSSVYDYCFLLYKKTFDIQDTILFTV